MTAAVILDGVTYSYPDAPHPALVDVSLELPEGSFVLVTGPTASGKSTLLRTVNGLVPHFTGGRFDGSVRTLGRDVLRHAPRYLADVVGLVPQDPASAFVVDRVEDELAYGMENVGLSPAVMRRRVEETLDLLKIEHLRDRSVRELSGGERQRVAIAAALTPGPRVLLLDEPTSQLDPQGAEDVLAALHRLVHDLGLTVVAAEHRIERVAGFADLAVRCDGGRVVAGEPHDVVDPETAGPPVAKLGRLLGWSPLPLTVRDARRRAASSGLSLRLVHADPAESGSALLAAEGLEAGYGHTKVLHGLDLHVAEGEVVALMGRNGAGKTTLLRRLSGLHSGPGTVLVRGRAPRAGHNVALCPQSPDSVLFKDSAAREVNATLEALGRSGAPETYLDALGLHEHDRHPRDLSAGERVLVATAAIAATGAPLLLLDEPTKGLDSSTKDRLVAYMRDHAARGAVIFATHDVELVARAATRVVILAGGEVIADGAPAEVLGDSPVFAPQMARVFGPGWLTPEQVVAAAAG